MSIKRKLAAAAAVTVLLASSFSSFADDTPLRVRQYFERNQLTGGTRMTYISITSLDDNIVLTGIEANRGRCNADGNVNRRLAYGEEAHFFLCRDVLIEAVIHTNKGTYTYHWN